MIAVFPQNQVSVASVEIDQYLETQVQTITPADQLSWERQLANDINIATHTKLEQELYLGSKLMEAKAKLTRRGEFSRFREKLLLSLAEGRKIMRVFKRFEGWSIDKLVIVSSAVNLYTLCQSKFAQVVQQLWEATEITKEFVKNLVKEVRDAARVERKKKQQSDPGSGWRRDPSEGGRHYQLPPMYNEEVAMKIEALAEERGVRAIVVVEEVIANFGETASSVAGGILPPANSRLKTGSLSRAGVPPVEKPVPCGETALKEGFPPQGTANPKGGSPRLGNWRRSGVFPSQATADLPLGEQPTLDELRHQHQEEMRAAVSEMRIGHIEMQRKLIERDARIAELEQLVKVSAPEPVEHNFSSWIEFADTVQCDRTLLSKTVKTWSLQERQALSTLLAEYLGEEQDALDQVAWVPEKLFNSALSKLSFCVSQISGDNIIDEPEIEHISGCRFICVNHLGNRRWEQWIFEGYGGRKLSIFGRDDFKIERYQN